MELEATATAITLSASLVNASVELVPAIIVVDLSTTTFTTPPPPPPIAPKSPGEKGTSPGSRVEQAKEEKGARNRVAKARAALKKTRKAVDNLWKQKEQREFKFQTKLRELELYESQTMAKIHALEKALRGVEAKREEVEAYARKKAEEKNAKLAKLAEVALRKAKREENKAEAEKEADEKAKHKASLRAKRLADKAAYKAKRAARKAAKAARKAAKAAPNKPLTEVEKAITELFESDEEENSEASDSKSDLGDVSLGMGDVDVDYIGKICTKVTTGCPVEVFTPSGSIVHITTAGNTGPDKSLPLDQFLDMVEKNTLMLTNCDGQQQEERIVVVLPTIGGTKTVNNVEVFRILRSASPRTRRLLGRDFWKSLDASLSRKRRHSPAAGGDRQRVRRE